MAEHEYGSYIQDDYDIDLELVPWDSQTFGPKQYARVIFAYYNTKTGVSKRDSVELPPGFDTSNLEVFILNHVGHGKNRG